MTSIDDETTRSVGTREAALGGRSGMWQSLLDAGDLARDGLLRTVRRLPTSNNLVEDVLREFFLDAVARQRLARERLPYAPPPVPAGRTKPDTRGLDPTIMDDARAAYLRALDRLPKTDATLVIGYVELGYDHAQLGCMMARTPRAALVLLRRALERLACEMAP